MASVGEELVRGLKARGVEVVFGIPGAHTIELYRGLAGSGVRHITARHEGGAAFMADGYARVSGKPGVALVITGPGLTNALTAMGQSLADSVPVLVVSGVNARAHLGLGRGYLHELPDQAGMVRSLCPSFQIAAPEQVEPILDLAFAAMTGGRPGPVHIEVPLDVMPMACPAAPATSSKATPKSPEPSLLAQAAELLNSSSKPVILAGGGCRGSASELRSLAERLDAPVIQTMNARGLMSGHPLSLAASPSLEVVCELLEASDCILALGTEIGETEYDGYATGHMADLSSMIRVDICALQLARRSARLKVQADAGTTIAALLPLLSRKEADGAGRTASTLIGAADEIARRWPEFTMPLRILEAIRETVPDAIVVGDSTQPIYAGNLLYDHDRAGGWFNSGVGFGSLGFAPGAAVGAAVAAPGVPVLCLVGDGGLQFSPGELRTAVDEGLPVTFIVWNSAGFLEIEKYMIQAETDVIGCHPSPLRMDSFAAACDLPFQSVPLDPDALRTALAKPCKGPRMIEIRAA